MLLLKCLININYYTLKKRLVIGVFTTCLVHCFCSGQKQKWKSPDQLRVSLTNPRLLETVAGTPVFLNNFTLWKLVEHGTREDAAEILDICRKNKYNMVSSMILGIAAWEGKSYLAGTTPYGARAFEIDPKGNPDPLKPITTPGNTFNDRVQYDFWDHMEYIIDLAAERGMYIGLHPAWGNWFSGFVHGQKPEDVLLFDENKAYKYGQWLGKKFGNKKNVVWMVGGDRSAVYDSKTKWYGATDVKDYRPLYRALAEGLADGSNGLDKPDRRADYKNIMISYHPRKWAPNSSEWFHNDPWLRFNSIQDTPIDQVAAFSNDYMLTPAKPTWLYEPVYEGAIHTWGVRYQAYQTVLMGGFGHTYGSDIWEFKSDWRELAELPGNKQMAHLNKVVYEIWSGKQFLNRLPDQALIVGDQGKTYGRGMTLVTDFETKKGQDNERSDKITAMRCKDGQWAMVYTSNGREVTLDLSRLHTGKVDAFWFNPRNGNWWVNGKEFEKPTPFDKRMNTGTGSRLFDPPGTPGAGNDWVLVLK